MKKILTRALLGTMALAGSALATAPASATNIIVNGSFEDPTASGAYQTITGIGPDVLPGWSIDLGNIDLVVQPPYAAYLGSQSLDLVGTGVSTGQISQQFATVIGQLYNLTFAYTNNTDNPGSVFSASYSVSGTPLTGTVFDSGSTASSQDWEVFSGYFTAASLFTTLTFADISGVGNQGLFLDAVSVSAAPEPATWAMMILGFGFVGAAMRRKSAVRAVFA